MDQKRLAQLIELPDVQRKILGGYRGAYSLGLTLHPRDRRRLVISVRIAGSDDHRIPRQVELDGARIPVLVRANFTPPVASGR
jgi:hypothetical protein